METPRESWEYAIPDNDYTVWGVLYGSNDKLPHRAYGHHRVTWILSEDTCTSTLQTVADLDDDGVYSTFESGAIYRMPDFDFVDGAPDVRVQE